NFETTFTVDIQPVGITTIIATSDNGQSPSADNYFAIVGGIIISPTKGTVGTIVNISGTGFTGNSSVRIDFGLTKTIAMILTGGNGAFAGVWTVNTQQYGTTSVSASNGSFVETNFIILPSIYSVSPSEGSVGTVVQINGAGYKGSEAIDIDFGVATRWTVNAGAAGDFSTVWTVDTQVYGSKIVRATGAIAGMAENSFFIRTAMHFLSPTTGTVGTIVTVGGTGYASNDVITLLFGTNDNIKTSNAGSNGLFEITFTVDTQAYGTATVQATGASSGTASKYFFVSPKISSIVPTAGTVGSEVTVNGTGYAASETITVVFGEIPVKTWTTVTGISGSFTTIFTVHIQEYGTKTINATGGLSSSAISTFFVQPAIYSISPSSGTVGCQITINGTGYKGYDNIRVDFGNTLSICTVIATSDGRILQTVFTVDTQCYGNTIIAAIGAASDKAQAVFLITPNMPTVQPTTGSVGTVVTIEGTGYRDSSTIIIDFGDEKILKTTDTDAEGFFATTFTINAQAYGTKTIAAYDTMSNRVERLFHIMPNIYEVTPSSGSVGQTVTIKGAGFVGSDTITIDFGNKLGIKIGSADSRGALEVSFVVDTQIFGNKMIVVNGTSSTKATSSFTIVGGITVSPTIGTIGTVVVVDGAGFGNNETITVDFGTEPCVGEGESSDDGTFRITFNTMYSRAVCGTTTISATGFVSKSYAESYIIIKPNYLVTPTTGTVGTMVRITGTGYGASDFVTIGFGNTVTIQTAIADESGFFETTFTVNTQKYGSITIKISGASSGIGSSLFFVKPDICSVSPSRGTIGTVVEIRGTGYGAGDIVDVNFGSTTGIITGVAVSSKGTFSVTFGVNTQPYGTTTITATGASSISANNVFIITPSIRSISPTKGTVGTAVVIKGIGYGVNDVIVIGFGNSVAVDTGDANANGTFTVSFRTDVQPYGTNTVVAIGVNSEPRAVCEGTFFVYPNLYSVNPNAGTVGMTITVKGSGYAAGEAIAIRFGKNMTIQNTVADPTSGFVEASFQIDTQVYGTTTVKFTGLVAGSATNTFFIRPSIYTVTPSRGSVGTQVEITGVGYAATEAVNVDFGTTSSIQTGMSNGIGLVSVIITVNAQPYGQKIIKLAGNSSATVEGTFTIIPAIYSVTPVSGSVGTVVEIKGSGYAVSDVITIGFGTRGNIQTAVADGNGYFIAAFTVDTQVFGTTTIIAAGTVSAINTFVILPQVVSVSPTAGSVGTVIIVTGTGYAANDNINIVFGTN
ncbi:hypothetical protein COZ71_04000, partial [Candidatus Desantisbacteria bacterium CG_4_8_14_3_um_filter_40_12]